ncbi:MAG: hypothetical protein PUB45_07015 [Bacteroidales bacterium]|nr:hypothetical protein [Bacteroidales bacterium]
MIFSTDKPYLSGSSVLSSRGGNRIAILCDGGIAEGTLTSGAG